MSFSVSDVIKSHQDAKTELAVMEQRHKEEMAPLKKRMDMCEKWLLAQADAQGVQNFKTDYGTAYKSLQTSVTMADKTAFQRYTLRPAIEALISALHLPPAITGTFTVDDALGAFIENVPWDLVDYRVAKSGVTKLLDDQKPVPPGLNTSRVYTLTVRKA